MHALLRWTIGIGIGILLLQACTALPPRTFYQETKIPVGPGPEDMVLNDFGARKQLIVSCDDRRSKDPGNGMIVAMDVETRRVDTLERLQEPHGMVFHPHGLDLAQVDDKLYLFVISHDFKANHHVIARYQLLDGKLYWTTNYSSPLFTSPNAVAAMPDASFYVSNDRMHHERLKEAIFRQKKAKVVQCDFEGNCHVVADSVQFGNGVTVIDGYLYQAATTGHTVKRYAIMGKYLAQPALLAQVRGPDNLRQDGDAVLVVCHLRGVAFMRHAANPKRKSPTVVYRITPGKPEPEVVYCNKGESISAGSTAIRVGNKLYICQVFEPWVLEVDLASPR